MARAVAALSGAAPRHQIIQYPVGEAPPLQGEERARAYMYVLFTFIAARLPRALGGKAIFGPFAGSCPDKL